MSFHKRILIAFLFCCFSHFSTAQFVTIPDTNFVNWLNNNGFSSCMNGNQLNSSCSLVQNTTSIYCANAGILDLTGISSFSNLLSLDCSFNFDIYIPSLPNNLKELYCINCNIWNLPNLPSSLEILSCAVNHLLGPGGGWLPNIKYIDIRNNDVTQIGFSGNTLEFLDCSFNQITSITSLPNSLKAIFCDQNMLTTLPALPDSLVELSCAGNLISSIPNLPSKLSVITCDNNYLSTLPPLPASLTYFSGNSNYFNTFPAIPKSLNRILCFDCRIYDLTNLNDTMMELDIRYNNNLKCLPPSKVISILKWLNTGISCFSDSMLVFSATPSIQNTPICNWNNVNNCAVGKTIVGSVFKDDNINCNLDTLEIKYPSVKVNLSNNGTLVQQTYTNQLGNYSFRTNAGTFEITPDTTFSNYLVNCPVVPSYTVMIDSLNPLESDKNFSIGCKPGFDLSAITVVRDSGVFRPGGFVRLSAIAGANNLISSLNCAVGVSGMVKVLLKGPISYVSSSPNSIIPNISGDTLLYSIADFATVNAATSFCFVVQVDTAATANQQVCISVLIDSIIGDLNFSNNNLSHCFNIVNSYDPNDKTVYPEGLIDSSQHWLTYTIRFQNTGNAPAIKVAIIDTLDQNLDESTFQLLAFSHDPEVQFVGSRLKFDFLNINLPDSISDEPNSHGFIQYKVKRNSSLSVGSAILNTASIYFDYNSPITTNTTYNQLIDPSNLVLIPDSNFVSWLKSNGYANCMYGNLMDTTCYLVINASTLNCSNSYISDLSGVQYFDVLDSLVCTNNQLAFLPTLPPMLENLNCSDNNLGLLSNLPFSLIYLNCSNNVLQSIPSLPLSLRSLICKQNQLISLPALPGSLRYLDCQSNQITLLNSVPINLNQIFISNNQLTSISNLPDTMTNLNISNNPNLVCLPYFERISSNFIWNGTGINCIPNILHAVAATPTLIGVPVCNYFNPNDCPSFPNIRGTVFSDANSNCVYNVSENTYRNIKLKLSKAGTLVEQTFSTSAGEYSFIANVMGSYFYEVDTFNLPYYVYCPTTFRHLSNIFYWDPFDENRDFSVYCKPGFDIGVSTIVRDTGIFKAGSISQVSVVAGDLSKKYNLNCAAGISGTLKVVLLGPVSFNSASVGALVPIVNGDTLLYSISNFGSVNVDSSFQFNVLVNPSAVFGDQICFIVSVTPIGGDNFVDNNNYSHCFTVVNSYGSNNKEVSPIGMTDTSQHWLTYTVNYQNVSGSVVQNLNIFDTLDVNLDPSTFELLTYSHSVQAQVRSNLILFSCSNISLPDSSIDQESSKGFIQFRVKRYNNLPIGTQIQNTAYIYFDFNAPVQTNTTINEIGVTSGVGVGEYQNPILFSIFPNPITSEQILNIYFNSSEKKKAELSVYDLSGRKLFTQFVNASEQSQVLTLPNISPGVYLVMLNVGKHQAQQKLVVLKNSN